MPPLALERSHWIASATYCIGGKKVTALALKPGFGFRNEKGRPERSLARASGCITLTIA